MQKLLLRTAIHIATIGCTTACQTHAPGGSPAPDVSSHAFTKPISFAILEDYDKGHSLRQVAGDFALFLELGIPAWRGSFGWDDYEPSPGRVDFVWLEQFARLADSMGISLRPYLGYTPDWAARPGQDEHTWNDPPRRAGDWVRFAGALAARLRPYRSPVSYEIYNEENVPLWWEGTDDEYAEVLRRGADAIRKADPEVDILLGGMVWPDLEWLESNCDDGQAPFDVLPFHAYPETWTPDSITVENYLGPPYRLHFLPEADRLCGRKPIWINEVGFATTPGVSEQAQAEWWVRAFATFLAEPRVEHLGIYEIRDQREGTPVIGDAPNYHLGLLRSDGTRKPAFATVKFLVNLFGSDSISVADPQLRMRVTAGKAGELHHHLFIRPDGTQLAFVWDRTSSPTVELELPHPASRLRAYDSTGEGTDWTDATGRSIHRVKLLPGVVRIFEAIP